MIFYKIIWHINATFKKIFLKLIYISKIKFGKKVTFRKRFNLAIDGMAKVTIGNNVFFNNDCSINAMECVTIGDNCIFGENVKIYDHNHIFKNIPQQIRKQGMKTGKVEIGDNCWICSNVIILKNVTIGNNCIIAAGSIIKQNIPDNSIVKNEMNLQIEKIGVD